MNGTLYIVSTPIGNLADISFRALRILSQVGLVAAEDTRTTGKLLKHYEISKPLVSYFSYNEARRTPELLKALESGRSIALVTDAGTPGISDPAYRIIKEALDRNLPVEAIPGPTALLPALIASGLPSQRFAFEGFLPVKGRNTVLQRLQSESSTIVLYESPHRLLRTLRDLLEFLGNRPAAIARELTKKFEEIRRGSLSAILEYYSVRAIKGEFVILVGAAQ
jgi:16S rRNA (cytidine1402-2'-O)-methyltransferase